MLDHNDIIADESNIQLMLKKGHTPHLANTMELFKAMINIDPECIIPLIVSANHLSASVSKFPEYIDKNFNISFVESYSPKEGFPVNAIFRYYG